MVGETDEEPDRSRPDRSPPGRQRDGRTGGDAAAARIQHQARWVDLQIERAMARGDFDDLPGAGKPLGDLGSPHDRDWWLKKLIEREQITGVLPAALMLRKEDAELDDRLDRESAERVVRDLVEDFNRRVVEARRQLEGGPPVVTPTRDVDGEVQRWRERQRARAARPAAVRPPDVQGGPTAPSRRRRWWRR